MFSPHLHWPLCEVFFISIRRKAAPILFLLSPEVFGTSGTMSIYIYIYIYMSTTWRTRSRYVIFWLYFGKIHSLASDFISEESFRSEEFFEVLF